MLFFDKKFRYEKFLKKAGKLDAFAIKEYYPLLEHLQNNAVEVTSRPLGLSLALVADTHGKYVNNGAPLVDFFNKNNDCDLCILLGDIHVSELKTILSCYPKEQIIAVKGNHDGFSLYSSLGIREISGQEYTHGSVSFVGIEGSFRYKDEKFPSFTQYQSLRLARHLPKAHVLISHDCMLSASEKSTVHCGLIGIADYVYSKGALWHFHGHIHKSYTNMYANGCKEKSVHLLERVDI